MQHLELLFVMLVSFMATVIQKQSNVSSNSGFSLLLHFTRVKVFCALRDLKKKKLHVIVKEMGFVLQENIVQL